MDSREIESVVVSWFLEIRRIVFLRGVYMYHFSVHKSREAEACETLQEEREREREREKKQELVAEHRVKWEKNCVKPFQNDDTFA